MELSLNRRLFARKNSTYQYASLFLLAVSIFSTQAFSANEVQLAEVYKQQNVSEYLLSEKYDGVRAIWKNNKLQTRSGNIINAPQWFIQDLPDVWLDGELWFTRGQFEFVSSTVRKQHPKDEQWKKIKYMVFDAPNYKDEFARRVERYAELVNALSLKHIVAVKQFKVRNNEELSVLLNEYVSKGAEGLMLHKASATFTNGRSGNILKVKPYMDAEAIVIAHIPGKGKYTDLMGAILVEIRHQDGEVIHFKIGSGFSDAQRKRPPAIGTEITFKFHGYTRKGVPRFASFIR